MKKLTLFLVSILLLPSCDFLKNSSGDNQKAAKKGAEQFIYDNKWENTTYSCSPEDSDGDGYITCSIYRKGELPVQVECVGHRYLSKNFGCKLVNTRSIEFQQMYMQNPPNL